MVVYNASVAPTNNKLFRQGISWALDRKRWADTTLQGKGSPYSLPFPKSSPAYEAAKEFHYSLDLDKARSLIQQAGLPSTDMEVIVRQSEPDSLELMQIWQADLAKVNVKLTVRTLENAAHTAQSLASAFQGATVGNGGFAHLQDPTTYFIRSGFVNPENGTSAYRDPKYSQLVDSAATEADAAKRKQLYSELTSYYLDASPATVAASTPIKVVTSSKVKDLEMDYSTSNHERFVNAWLEA
jgi:peptide/nickel transport system substrate-binding protein